MIIALTIEPLLIRLELRAGRFEADIHFSLDPAWWRFGYYHPKRVAFYRLNVGPLYAKILW